MEQTAGATDPQGSDRRTWLIGAVAIVALITIAGIAVVLMSSHEEAVYDSDSPEATVQAYAHAWAEGDVDSAWQLLTPRVQARVHESEFRNAMSWDEDVPARVWVEERHDFPDWVALTLSVERTGGGLLGPSRDVHPLRLKLIEVDDGWRIDTPIVGFYPW